MGGIYGCGYQEMGVVRMYKCSYIVGVVVRRYIYRFPHTSIVIHTPLVLALFGGSSIPTSLFI